MKACSTTIVYKKKKRLKAFGLSELMVSIALISVVIVGTIAVIVQSFVSIITLNQRTKANELIQEQSGAVTEFKKNNWVNVRKNTASNGSSPKYMQFLPTTQLKETTNVNNSTIINTVGSLVAGPTGNTQPYVGQYYNNFDFSGSPTLTRTDQQVDFDYTVTSQNPNPGPDPSIGNGPFSVIWTKTDTFNNGHYIFSFNADNGGAVYIDDKLVIDNWSYCGCTKTYETDFTNSTHKIVVQYHADWPGWNWVHFLITNYVPGTLNQPYKADYFSNTNLSGTPAVSRYESQIQNNYSSSPPPSPISSNNFSARFTRTDNFTAGTYAYNIDSEEGVRFYIDGNIIVDQWYNWGQSASGTYNVSQGTHTIVIEYFNTTGSPYIYFSFYVNTPLGPVAGYTANYYNNQFFEGTPALTRTESSINLNLPNDTDVPGPGVNHDNISASWTWQDTFQDGVYTFLSASDDTENLLIDGAAIADTSSNIVNISYPTRYIRQIHLTAGVHTLMYKFVQYSGGALAQLNYYFSGLATDVLNGYYGDLVVGDSISLTSNPNIYARVVSIVSSSRIIVDKPLGDGTSQGINRFQTYRVYDGHTNIINNGTTYDISLTLDKGLRNNTSTCSNFGNLDNSNNGSCTYIEDNHYVWATFTASWKDLTNKIQTAVYQTYINDWDNNSRYLSTFSDISSGSIRNNTTVVNNSGAGNITLVKNSGNYISSGTYTTSLFDTYNVNPSYFSFDYIADLPSGTSVNVSIRSGTSLITAQSASWTNVNPQCVTIPGTSSPTARIQCNLYDISTNPFISNEFYQIQLTLNTTVSTSTPNIKSLKIYYL